MQKTFSPTFLLKEPYVKFHREVATAMLLAAYDKHLTIRGPQTDIGLFTQ